MQVKPAAKAAALHYIYPVRCHLTITNTQPLVASSAAVGRWRLRKYTFSAAFRSGYYSIIGAAAGGYESILSALLFVAAIIQ